MHSSTAPLTALLRQSQRPCLLGSLMTLDDTLMTVLTCSSCRQIGPILECNVAMGCCNLLCCTRSRTTLFTAAVSQGLPLRGQRRSDQQSEPIKQLTHDHFWLASQACKAGQRVLSQCVCVLHYSGNDIICCVTLHQLLLLQAFSQLHM